MDYLTRKLPFLILLFAFCSTSMAQSVIETYQPAKNDSIRIGTGEQDYMPFIQKGYTIMLPESKAVKGVIILFEDSRFDQKNRNAKQLYDHAAEKGFALLSVSTEIPLDFFFSEASMLSAHHLVHEAFITHRLPNKNVFFTGASLVGHRAMQYIKFLKEGKHEFQPRIAGIVLCHFTLDWTRKWHQHKREIRINRNDLWEAKFINYMLETNLNGTPYTAPEYYHDFSPYSYSDDENRNIKFYTDYAVRAYANPAIKYRFSRQLKTMYENNTTDVLGFLAELELAGNERTDLIVLPAEDDPKQKKNAQTTWNSIDKGELVEWIHQQTGN
ncbi:MAG: hypothetical protein KI786_05490 [Mameliella sp.]|nr:hypothetical protein [Phaeodactylibacter sp.]